MTTLLPRIWHGLTDKREVNPCFSLAVVGLFCVGLSLIHYNHELWRDEIHCWSVARNSKGLWDLLTGIRRYDGHPFLWYYLLYLVSRWSRSEVYLHVVTIVLATSSAYLWLRYANLPRILRVMLLCTYWFFFEYGVLSRSYALGVFLAFLFCRLYDPRSLRILRHFVVLSLLSFTSVYGLILACSLGTFLLWQSMAQILSGQLTHWQRRTLYWQWFWGSLLVVLALVVHIKTSLPPPDAYYSPSWMHMPPLLSPDGFPKQFWTALFPWNTRNSGAWIVSGYLGDALKTVPKHLPALATLALALWLVAVRRVPGVVVAFLLGVVLISLFQAHRYAGYLRHWGHFFVLLIVCVWLYAKQRKPHSVLLYLLFAATMALQMATCFRAVRSEIEMPFSGAQEAANFLRQNGLDREPMMASYDHAASAVAGYLDRRFISAETGEEGQTVVFHNRRDEGPAMGEILKWGRQTIRDYNSPILLLLNFDPGSESLPDVKADLLYVTKPSLVADETFWIYRLSLIPPAELPR